MDVLYKVAEAVCEMAENEVVTLIQEALRVGIDPLEILNNGLIKGMEKAGQLFEEQEYFVAELLLCSDAMYAGLEILQPLLLNNKSVSKGKVVIGVVEGDTHDIGKNIVKIMLETASFEVIDLGRDVPIARFIDKAMEVGADMIALSTLMTTTMQGMEKLIILLQQRGLRDRFKVLIGGGPVSQAFADKIGADGYSINAFATVRLAERLLCGNDLIA